MKKTQKILLTILMMFIVIFGGTTVQAAKSSNKLSIPKNVKASISGTSNVKIKWTKVNNAKKYTIYRATTKSGKYKKVSSTKSISFVDKKTERGKTYYYKVCANNSKANSKKSNAVKITVPSKNKALKEIRKALKNKNWVNKNLKIKYNVFGEKVNSKSKQELTFGKFKGKEVVMVDNLCMDEWSAQSFLVGYHNGKVVAKPISEYPVHCFHGGYVADLNHGMIDNGYMHMGYCGDTFYKVSNINAIEKACFTNNEYSDETKIEYNFNNKVVSKSKYKKEMKKYNKYKFTSMTTKLTSKNIDKYIK